MKDINSIYKHMSSSNAYKALGGNVEGDAEGGNINPNIHQPKPSYNRETEQMLNKDEDWKDREGVNIMGFDTGLQPAWRKAWNEGAEFWAELPGAIGGLFNPDLKYDVTMFDEGKDKGQQLIIKHAEIAYAALRKQGISKDEAFERIQSSFENQESIAAWFADPAGLTGVAGGAAKATVKAIKAKLLANLKGVDEVAKSVDEVEDYLPKPYKAPEVDPLDMLESTSTPNIAERMAAEGIQSPFSSNVKVSNSGVNSAATENWDFLGRGKAQTALDADEIAKAQERTRWKSDNDMDLDALMDIAESRNTRGGLLNW